MRTKCLKPARFPGSLLVMIRSVCLLFCVSFVAQSPSLHGQTPPELQAGANSGVAGGYDPSPGNFLGVAKALPLPATDGQPPAANIAQAVAAAPSHPVPVLADAGGDKVRQQINDETANLLAMVYVLKAEVDQTNKDELSVVVVRQADRIEKMARKVRDEMRPAVGKN